MDSDEIDRFSAREKFQIRAVEIGQDRARMMRLALQGTAKAVAVRPEVQPVKRAEGSGEIGSPWLSEFFFRTTFSNFPAQVTRDRKDSIQAVKRSSAQASKRSSVRVG